MAPRSRERHDERSAARSIYGKNKDGKEVEVYFNPVDGSIVKEEVEDKG